MARRLLVVVLVALNLLVAPTVASAIGRPEHKALEFVNGSRARAGRRPVSARLRLMRYAERHARAMARHRTLFHSSLAIDGFSALGECVGEGSNMYVVHQAFMRSSVHRRIILGTWRWIGIGVVRRSGVRYVTEVFAR